MKYYLIAGEASGDLHGANLMYELKKHDTQAQFRFWGGDLMQQHAGHQPVKHYRELAFMGLWEVLINLRTIKRNIELCKQDIVDYQPDVVILIDYPGFNLRIARFAHENSLKVFYYISPKIWAWKKSRAKQIKKYVDKMFTIFPFETNFYSQFNYQVDFVGNPLLDAIEQKQAQIPERPQFLRENGLSEKSIIALLPGSRKQEIERILPTMLSVIPYFPHYQFVIAVAPATDRALYEKYTANYAATLVPDATYSILQYSDLALVTSGTATLETALMRTPQIVCYKTNALTFAVGRQVVKIEYMSLVNLIMNDQVVLEMLQNECNTNELRREMNRILHDKLYRNTMLNNYELLRIKLGGSGASARSAQQMVEALKPAYR